MNEESPVYIVQHDNGQGGQHTIHCTLLYPCNELPIDESVGFEPRKKNISRNQARNIPNSSKRSYQAKGVDADDDEINIGFYPNEMQPNLGQYNANMPAPINKIEPDPEQELGIAVDNAQDPMLEIETGPKQDQNEQFIAVDHTQDHDILPQPHKTLETLSAQDIYNDAAPRADAQPPL